ncbi:phosphoribosylanthranilate isomerase [Helicobacter sp. T3_23-1056]
MKIKFCGLFRECDIEFANALMPDFVGFVFARQSKRFVDFALAGELKARLNSQIKAVGVFVDSPVERVCEAVQSKIIDIVQLHGNENNAYISALRESLQKDCGTITPIIKAIKMRDLHSLNLALKSSADFILLDSAKAGSGVAFEWEILEGKLHDSRNLQGAKSNNTDSRDLDLQDSQGLDSRDLRDFTHNFASRFFLAGGINADNLPRAMSLNPYAIDISSGIESEGKKNFKKMQQIIKTLRASGESK